MQYICLTAFIVLYLSLMLGYAQGFAFSHLKLTRLYSVTDSYSKPATMYFCIICHYNFDSKAFRIPKSFSIEVCAQTNSHSMGCFVENNPGGIESHRVHYSDRFNKDPYINASFNRLLLMSK